MSTKPNRIEQSWDEAGIDITTKADIPENQRDDSEDVRARLDRLGNENPRHTEPSDTQTTKERTGGKGKKLVIGVLGGLATAGLVVGAGIYSIAGAIKQETSGNTNRGEPVDPTRPPVAEAPVVPDVDQSDVAPVVDDEPSHEPAAPTTQELVEPAGTEFSRTVTARGIPIPEHIQVVRDQAVELCTTGEGGKQMADDWAHYGLENSTGMTWPAAFTFMADGSWEGGTEAYATAENVYRNINELATNCQEGAFIASSGLGSYFNNYVIAEAREELSEFRALPYNPTTTIFANYQQTINESYDKGYIERPN